MFRTKSLSDNFNSSQSLDINQISPKLRVEYIRTINDMHHQLFFDPDLTHQHLMFLLDNRNTIENELIQFLNDRIHHLNIPRDIREYLIKNLNQFSTNFTLINTYSNINHRYHVNYDFDEESYLDSSNDDIYSDEDDSYNDLENLILDEIEMERDIIAFL